MRRGREAGAPARGPAESPLRVGRAASFSPGRCPLCPPRRTPRGQREHRGRPLSAWPVAGGPAGARPTRHVHGAPVMATRRPHREPAQPSVWARQLVSSWPSQQAGDTCPPPSLLSHECRRVTQVSTSGCITPVTVNPSSPQMNTSGLQTNSNPATNALVPSPNPVCFLQSWAHDRQSLGATLSAWVAPVPLYFYPFKDQKGTIYVQVELRGSRGGSRLRGRDVDTSEERAGDLQVDGQNEGGSSDSGHCHQRPAQETPKDRSNSAARLER